MTDDGLLVVGAFTSAYSNAFLAYSRPLDGQIQQVLMRKISEKKDQRLKNSTAVLVMVFSP